jgi:hypothetical protein
MIMKKFFLPCEKNLPRHTNMDEDGESFLIHVARDPLNLHVIIFLCNVIVNNKNK